MLFSKIITTCFGIGYIQKGAGTLAALFCCLCWYFLRGAELNFLAQSALLLVLFFIGVFTSGVVEKEWGKDSNRVVVDEVHGMLMSVFLLPPTWQWVFTAFLLFRVFDIAKPLGIRKMEALPGGWGVMTDDVLAGVYSNVLLQIAHRLHLFA